MLLFANCSSADYFSSTLTTREAKISSEEGKGRLVGNPSPWLEDGGGCFPGFVIEHFRGCEQTSCCLSIWGERGVLV